MLTAQQLQNETQSKLQGSDHPDVRLPLLQARIEELHSRVDGVLAVADLQRRQLTDAEVAECNLLTAERDRVGRMTCGRIVKPTQPMGFGGDFRRHETSLNRFVDQHGQEIVMLRPDEKLMDLPSGDGPSLSLGKTIRGMVTGKWDHAQAERLSMAEGSNVYGGYLVQDKMWRQIVDYARNRSAVIKAGALTIPFSESDTLVMARVKADPTFEVVGENAAMTERSLTFERLTFTPQKIGCWISGSRELFEDAPNTAPIVEQTLARAIGVELDRIALEGTGSSEPNGLLNYTGLESTGTIGAIAWEDVHAAAVEVRDNNFEPTGYICSPTIGGDLDIITSGDGTNSAKLWLGPPPSLNGVKRFTTKNCSDANLYLGQWDQFAIALRQDAMIEVSTTAGDAFKKHQVFVKITMRADVGALHIAAFHALTGITT
jgi:HK97 family phage major capsid protein